MTVIRLKITSAKDMSVEEIALGFLDVANEAMCRPIRQVHTTNDFEFLQKSFDSCDGLHRTK